MDSTQLRLHGRWMDLATQAAEAPTSDAKKKLLGVVVVVAANAAVCG